jgi:nucleoside-diphosphate-sugar epimerase
MKVLVTGATGFLGGHLASRLVRQGDEVRALARRTSKIGHFRQQGVEVVYGDLKDRETLQHAVDGMEIVYHAGAAMSGSWKDFEESTIKGTERMLELSLEAGVKRFVHVSSLAVYQVYELQKNTLVNENNPYEKTPEKVGHYAHSKVEAEKLAFRFHEKGLPVVIVRPGIIYGPRGKVLFPHIGYPVKNKLFVIIGNGDNLLPLTYIDNTVEAILSAGAKEGVLGQAYNIVDDEAITQREYLEKYMAATHSRFLTLSMPFSLLLLSILLVEQMRNLGILTKASSPSMYGLVAKYKSLRFDTCKAKKELNWHPEISLEEGLKNTFDWYNNNHRAR